MNHQNLLSRLSMGLCQFADLLPRTELILQLYPTEQIKHAIVTMYAHILKFLLRALRWYQESKPMHIIHAITRPPELRYDDLLKKISLLSQNLTELALVSSYSEQRDMHTKIQQLFSDRSEQKSLQMSLEQLTAVVSQIHKSVVAEQVINASARIEIRQSLSEIQLFQFMGHLSVTSLLDPTKTFQMSLFMRNRRLSRRSKAGPPFWLDSRLQLWNRCRDPSLIMINGTCKLRFHVKDFCTDSIATLRNSSTPVI